MSSYFDDASLVMIPSGYKTSKVYSVKPTDGTGDLTFTRSNDTATRVASNGLIEKVRTNLALQSEAFDNASWSKTTATVTANTTTAPNGTLTADKLVAAVGAGTAAQHRVDQTTVSAAGAYTFSVYAKKAETQYIFLRIGASLGAYCDLNNGQILGVSVGITAKSEDAGNGWYRIIITNPAASANEVIRINLAVTVGNLNFIGNGTDGAFIWGAQYELNDIATDYIPTTAAAVSVGPVANLPRLNYPINSDGSVGCPSLLLEPQRTNVVLFSEQFNNAAWGSAGITITANQAVSPDGNTNADLAVNSSSVNYLYQNLSSAFSGTYTVSIFAKKGTQSSFAFGLVAGGFAGGMGVKFNFDTQTFSTPINYANFTSMSASYQSYGNGWYRLNLTGTTATSTTYFFVLGSLQESFAVNAYIYGAQLEAGAYATSYIPTLGAAVTRGADDADTTFASAFATDGGATWFLEFDGNTIPQVNQTGANFALNFASGDYLGYNHNANPEHRFRVQASGVGYFAAASGLNANSPAKLAVRVTASSYTAYANGVEINTASIVGNWASATNLITTINDSFGSLGVKQMIFFPTALSNAQLAELTA